VKIGFNLWFWIVRQRITILIIFIVVASIYSLLHFLYPPSTLIIGVDRSSVDADGKLNGRYKTIQEHLNTYGIKLEYRVQNNKKNELPLIEWAVKNPEIDFVFHLETGGQPPEEVTSLFRSAGAIRRTLLYFYIRNGVEITNLRDLIGKKIIFSSPPYGGEAPASSKRFFLPSIYSNGWVYYQVFLASGVSPKNSKIINAWPEPITAKMDWDVMITRLGIPPANSLTNQTRSEILRGDIKLANIRDIQAISAWRAAYDTYNLVESSLSIVNNFPPRDVRLLSVYESVAVKKDLDPSLVLILAEALKEIYSEKRPTTEKNEFPNYSVQGMFEPHPVAQNFYQKGKPFLTNYVSPGLATFLMKLALIFIPLLTILWPIASLFPRTYALYVKHRIARWYVDLELIEKSLSHADRDTRKIYMQKVDAIRQRLAELRLPIMHRLYAKDLFTARQDVDSIRNKIKLLTELEEASHSRTNV